MLIFVTGVFHVRSVLGTSRTLVPAALQNTVQGSNPMLARLRQIRQQLNETATQRS